MAGGCCAPPTPRRCWWPVRKPPTRRGWTGSSKPLPRNWSGPAWQRRTSPGTMPDTDRPVVVEPAGSGVLVGIRSPGFETVPPDFTQPELIPDSVRQACLAWEQRRFAPREVTIRVARDVFVAAEGLVFDREGQVLRASIHQHEPEMIAAAADAVRRAAMGEAVPT